MVDVLFHHWYTYEPLSRKEGSPLELARKHVSTLMWDNDYGLVNPHNRQTREEAVARVIEAFRKGDVVIVYEKDGVMDEICRACASDTCDLKPSNQGLRGALMRIKAQVFNE